MPLPIVQLRDIPPDGLDLECPLDDAWLAGVLTDTEYQPRSGGPRGVAHVNLFLSGREVLFRGNFRAAVDATCVRCLEPAHFDLASDFSLALHPASAPSASAHPKRGEKDMTAEELDQDVYTDDKVDVGHWVREQLLLELPAHPMCVQGCELAVASSLHDEPANEIDARLAPLKNIKLTVTKKKENRRGRSQA